MTATVQFQTAVADNVLTVPNVALRIKPTEEMLAEVASARGAADSSHSAAKPAASDSVRRAARSKAGVRPTIGTLWFTDSTGALHETRVRIGLTDGQKTQVEGKNITEGMQVITSVAGGTPATSESANAASPFQTGRQGGMGGRRGR
jgi:HlyD family secretion protein